MPNQTRRLRAKKSVLFQLGRSAFPVAAAVTLGWIGRVDAQATASWTGAGDGKSWTNSSNWSVYPPTGDNLIFGGGTVGTIQLQGNQNASSVAFNAGFTLDPPAGTDTLTIVTGTVSVGSSVSATINAIIAGTNGLNFAGPGTLTISGANSYSNGTKITGGTLIATGSSSIGAGSVSVAAGSQLTLDASTQLAGAVTNNGTIDIASGQTLSFSTLNNYSFTQNAGTLAVTGVLNMGGSTFYDDGGSISGTVQLGTSNQSPDLFIGPSAGNSGTFIFTGEGGYLEGSSPTAISSAMTVTLQPTSSAGTLDAFNNVTNAGNLNIIGSATSTATMYMSSETLTNTGTLTTSVTGTPTTVQDFIYGTLNNTTGTVNINASTQFSGSITNNGTFDIASGQTMTFSTLSSYTFTQNAGTLSINGVLKMAGDTFYDEGGTITGTVQLGTSNQSPDLFIGPSAGNSGTFMFTGEGGYLEGSNPIVISSGVTVTFQPTSAAGTLNAFSNVTNAGNLNIIGSATSTATMYMSSQTLTNTGTLTTSVTGTPTTVQDFIYGTVTNTTGTVNLNASTQFSGSITNNGTFDIASGQTLSFSTLSSYTFTQNAGTLSINGVLKMAGDTFYDEGGTITGTVQLGTSNQSPDLFIGPSAGNSGTFIFTGEGGYLEGSNPIVIASGVTVTFQPTSATGELSAFENLTNAGYLNIIGSATSTATMYLSSETLTNTGTLTTSVTGTPTTVQDYIYGTFSNTTGTVNINASTQFSGSITNNGTFDIASGQTMTFSTLSNYTFTQNAGTLAVTGVLNIAGNSFYDYGGTITGTVQLGTSNASPDLFLGPSAGNSGTFIFTGEGGYLEGSNPIVIPSGVTVTFQPTSATGELGAFENLTNAGNLNLIGSATSTATMYMSSETLTNTGTLTTSVTGTPTTVQDFIYGTVNNTTGTVNINASTQFSGNITNNGTFDIASGQTMTFSTLSNYSFTQNAGTLAVTGVLNMAGDSFYDYGGTVTGTLLLGTSNSAPDLYLGPSAGSSGTFIFTGEGGTLEGGNPIVIPSGVTVTLQTTSAAGTLSAFGNVTNAGNLNIIGSATSTASMYLSSETLTNTGTLTTSVTGTPTTVQDFISGNLNNSTGTVNIDASTQFTGSITNNGTFDIASGQTLSFSNSSYTFTQNAGTLTVNGVLNISPADFHYTGGTLNLPSQELDFAAASDPDAIFGNTFTLSVGQSLNVNNIEFLKGNGSSVTQNGGSNTNNGLFIGNNSGSGSNAVYTLNAGTLTINPGDSEAIGYNSGTGPGGGTFNQLGGTHTVPLLDIAYNASGIYNLSGGTLNAGSLYLGVISPGGTLNISGGNATANSTVNDGTIAQSGGTSSLGAVTGSGTISVGGAPGGAGTMSVSSISLPTVSISGAGKLTILSNTTATSNTIDSLSITGNGTLDITNNELIIDYGSGADPIASIAALIKSGYAGGTWTGTGINSTIAQTNSGSYGIGYADASDNNNPAGLATGEIEIKYTLLGDANLDGAVNSIDFAILASNFNKAVVGPSGWDQGDFNYDGSVNSIDFAALAGNFNKGASEAADLSALEAFASANGLLADVPEPGVGVLIATVATGLLYRRRRNLFIS